jgi:hypothetical protein
MNLTVCSLQGGQSLEEFCKTIGGDAVLRLIHRLQNFPDDRTVFARFAVDYVCLLAEDYNTAEIFVGAFVWFKLWPSGEYEVEYAQSEAPWRGASEEEAFEMILVGMEKSGGWPAASTDRL